MCCVCLSTLRGWKDWICIWMASSVKHTSTEPFDGKSSKYKYSRVCHTHNVIRRETNIFSWKPICHYEKVKMRLQDNYTQCNLETASHTSWKTASVSLCLIQCMHFWIKCIPFHDYSFVNGNLSWTCGSNLGTFQQPFNWNKRWW